jgi:5,10-methylenetetrahydromethanopterin reductase
VTRELGVGLLTDQEPDAYEAIARRLDAAGVDCLSVFHDLRYQPAIGPLLLAARVTERIRLGPMLDLVSRGRAYLGLAKGAWLDLLGLHDTDSIAALREAVEVIGKLLAGDDSGVEGERFRLEPGVTLAYQRFRERIPLLIGTWGPRTAAWAGMVAEELKIGGSANPDLIPVVRGWLGDAPTRIVVGCVTVVDDDATWARERARAAVAGYLDVVGKLDPTLELRPAETAPLEKFTIAGTPEMVADRVRELWVAGADRVELGTPQGRTTRSGIDLICDRVLPLLRDV